MSKETRTLPPLTAEEVHLLRNGLVQYLAEAEQIVKRHHHPESDWFVELLEFKTKTERLLEKLPGVLCPSKEEPRFVPE